MHYGIINANLGLLARDQVKGKYNGRLRRSLRHLKQ